jgi:hypothetical protein
VALGRRGDGARRKGRLVGQPPTGDRPRLSPQETPR